MKKLMILSAAVLAVSFSPMMVSTAMADDHEAGKAREHDLNGDGVISKSEFLSRAEERFSKMDADGNGEISKEEGKAARKNMHEKMKERKEKRKERREERRDAAE